MCHAEVNTICQSSQFSIASVHTENKRQKHSRFLTSVLFGMPLHMSFHKLIPVCREPSDFDCLSNELILLAPGTGDIHVFIGNSVGVWKLARPMRRERNSGESRGFGAGERGDIRERKNRGLQAPAVTSRLPGNGNPTPSREVRMRVSPASTVFFRHGPAEQGDPAGSAPAH